MRNIVFFDYETTGTDPRKAKPLEIFLMRCVGPKLMPVSYFHTMINPEMKIPEGAQKVNNIKQEWVDLAPKEDESLEMIFQFINEGDTVCAHNAERYDMHFLKRYKNMPNLIVIDTIKMAKEAGFKSGKRSQTSIFKHLYPDEEIVGEHRAMDDVKRLRKIFIGLEKMIGSTPKLF